MLLEHHLRSYCAQRPGATEEYPFGPDSAVYKVMGKIFAIVSISDNPARISLKCDPEWAILLRDTYPAVQPGYHMNKKHWNTLHCDGSIPDDEILQMIRHSYELIVKKLKKVEQEALQKLIEE